PWTTGEPQSPHDRTCICFTWTTHWPRLTLIYDSREPARSRRPTFLSTGATPTGLRPLLPVRRSCSRKRGQMSRFIRGGVMLALLASVVSLSPFVVTARQQTKTIQAKTAKAKAPQQPPLGAVDTRSILPPNATALLNRKQQRLRQHHL